MSDDDLDEFEREFGDEPYLEEAEFDMNGEHGKFKYKCGHYLMSEFKSYLAEWLNNHDFPARIFFLVSHQISLYSNEELSDNQIQEFEEEFNLKCNCYIRTCGSNGIKYEFI